MNLLKIGPHIVQRGKRGWKQSDLLLSLEKKEDNEFLFRFYPFQDHLCFTNLGQSARQCILICMGWSGK